MTDEPGFRTRLTQAGRASRTEAAFVNPPLVRGSTVTYPTVEALRAANAIRYERGLFYGICGTETTFALAETVAMIEGGAHCQITGSGLSAITTALLACLGAGEHCLLPDSVYGPTRRFADSMLDRFGVAATYYPPTADPDALARLARPETRVVLAESPGSHTFEMQDVVALARFAHARGARLLLDNTWGLRIFQPFAQGVDISIQALTKYAGGHADVILGALTTADEPTWRLVRDAALCLGQYASPDDCWLALRGLRTLAVRLAAQGEAGLRVASWLQQRPEVLEVRHPALPGAPGHEIWRRDYTGACGLFGVVFRPPADAAAIIRMANALRVFAIGESWGGYESLFLPTTGTIRRTLGLPFDGAAARLHIGLEDVDDLIADLDQAMGALRDG